jgi:hypothetical protein
LFLIFFASICQKRVTFLKKAMMDLGIFHSQLHWK